MDLIYKSINLNMLIFAMQKMHPLEVRAREVNAAQLTVRLQGGSMCSQLHNFGEDILWVIYHSLT